MAHFIPPLTIEEAAELLRRGELVVIPTETVYGLAANAFDERAVQKIFAVKGRPASNPLIVHLPSSSTLGSVAINIPEPARQLAEKYWPGPLTLVLERSPAIPDSVTAGQSTVALRVPAHPVTLKLLSLLDFPLAAPSANRSNHLSPTRPEHVQQSLGENTPPILDGGRCSKGVESTIIGFEEGEAVLYRHGAIPSEALKTELGSLRDTTAATDQPISPGMMKKHYSPHTPLITSEDLAADREAHRGRKVGQLLIGPGRGSEKEGIYILSPTGSLQEAAYELFHKLYLMDQRGFDVILVERAPDEGLGKTINDRLRRAAADANESH